MTEEGGNSLLIDQLAARAQAGCHQSFEQLVQQYHQQIYNFLYQMTRNVHDAQDLTQETFIRACHYMGNYNAQFKFSTWLFTIARNCAVTHFRKQKSLEKTKLAGHEESVALRDNSGPSQTDDTIWIKARQLKPKHFEALWLHYHEGFSVQETAAIMGSNSVYVKVLLHRARQALALKMKTNKQL
ncbi:MAG: RNA polymerase sigma factor [Verrucomicrobiales bacterium]